MHLLPVVWDGLALHMAYMDVPPATAANGETVLLMHGRNFPSSYWEGTIAALAAAGWRVVAPDQIHFGKSSMPDDRPVNFDVMAAHTVALLDHLKLPAVHVVAHSMGGMAAMRLARNHPGRVKRLVPRRRWGSRTTTATCRRWRASASSNRSWRSRRRPTSTSS